MKIKKGEGKNKQIPQDDFGMWVSDKLKQQEADKEKRLKQITGQTKKGTK